MAASPGPTYPWVGSVDDTNTGTGNKLTSIGIVSWTQRGGLPFDLSLNHNSQSSRSGELGPKWLLSYDDTLSVDGSGNVTVYWGDGRVCKFTKNANGSWSAPAGVHDVLGGRYLTQPTRLVSYVLTTTSQTSFTFSAAGYLTAMTDENNNSISLGYINTNGTNLVKTLSDAAGRTLTLGYTGNKLTSVSDPLNHQWTLSYDAGGNLAHINWPVLNGTTYSVNLGYNSSHNIISYQDRRGNTSTFGYNSDSSLASETDAAGNQTNFSYGSTATTITDPNGHTTVHTYNSSGQLASVTDALGYTEYYAYDTANNVTQKQDRRGYTWNSTYDGMGNLLTAKDPYGNTTTYTYNSHNKLLTQTWPSGRSLANAYDTADNLTQVQEKDAAGNVKSATTYAIGSYGLVASKTDANSHQILYTYDSNGYLASTTTPLGHKTQWTYDALGFRTSRTDAMSRTTYYTPDAWERNITTTYPDNTTATFAYDANSNLTAFNNYTANWSRTYDADNRMLFEYCGGTRDDTHTYDAAGQKGLLSTVTDFDGRVISYTYSARNELASVGDSTGTTSYAYDADGHQTHLYNPNGTRTDQDYNNDGTLDSYYNWNGGSTIFASFGYTYNADHQITSQNEGTSTNVHTLPNPTQTAYGYDAQGHLTSESRTGSGAMSQTFSYDAVGNRTNYNNGNPYTYDADDAPTGAGGGNTFVLSYNANGDRTSESFNGQVTTFTYDFDDQLMSITSAGTTITYRYDPTGRQVSKVVTTPSASTVTGYYLDGDQMQIEKVNGVNAAQYLWGNGLIRCNGEYPLTDGRGNVRLSTNSSQQVTSTNQPDAFGLGSVTSGTASSYAYGASSGYREDGISPAGLPSYYAYQKVGARYYDPTFAVFLTRDTDLSQSAYAYCDGDPVNRVDPSGHSWRQVGGFFLAWGGASLAATGIFVSGATEGVGTLLGGAAAAAAGGAMIGKGWRMMHGEP